MLNNTYIHIVDNYKYNISSYYMGGVGALASHNHLNYIV